MFLSSLPTTPQKGYGNPRPGIEGGEYAMFVKIEEVEDNSDLPKAEVSKDGVQNYFDSYGDWRESHQEETTSMNLAVRLSV